MVAVGGGTVTVRPLWSFSSPGSVVRGRSRFHPLS